MSLVDRGLFPGGVELCFLPKGHTHNEMDQHASRVSIGVRKRDVFNRDQLMERLALCYKGLAVERIQHVADTKAWLNPGIGANQIRNWTKSQFRFLHGISTRRFFRIARDQSTGRLEVRFKEEATNEDWSEPWFPLKNPDGPVKLDPAKRGLNAIRPLAPARKKLIRSHVEGCMPRVPYEFREVLQDNLKMCLEQTPVEFHWRDGGKFKQESADVEFYEHVADADAIEFQRPPGVYDNPLRPGFNPDGPGFLLVGNFVAVVDRPWYHAPTTKVGFRVGKIITVDKGEKKIGVRWFTSGGGANIHTVHWRPYIGQAKDVIVPLSDLLMTFRTNGFTPVNMLLTAAIRKCILYKLRSSNTLCLLFFILSACVLTLLCLFCRRVFAGQEEMSQAREREVLSGLNFNATSIEEYLADVGENKQDEELALEALSRDRLENFTAVLLERLKRRAARQAAAAVGATSSSSLSSPSSSSPVAASSLSSSSSSSLPGDGDDSDDGSDDENNGQDWICICGFQAKNKSGFTRHTRACDDWALANEDEEDALRRDPPADLGTGAAVVDTVNIVYQPRRPAARLRDPTAGQEPPLSVLSVTDTAAGDLGSGLGGVYQSNILTHGRRRGKKRSNNE